MHGDFSLNPLAYRPRVSRVLSQQGRVQLDSDANEQTASLLRAVRALAADLIGAHGGIGNAFEVVVPVATKLDVLIRWGVYYVDGIQCTNFPADFDILTFAALNPALTDGLSYTAQHDYVAPNDGDWTAGAKGNVLFFVDAFELHVSAAEDDSLREVALLGPDTASRAIVIWQVRAMPADDFSSRLAKLTTLPNQWNDVWDEPYLALNLLLKSGVRMRARAVVTEATEPCTVSPDARYRGVENRLFRVEIHDPGGPTTKPTFKWSADNASLVYPIREIAGKTVHLDSLGRDDRTTIRINDWVEVVDDHVQSMGQAHPLLQVVDVRPYDMTVTLDAEPEANVGSHPDLHPILRRWATEPQLIREAKNEKEGWVELTDGLEVQFSREAIPDAGYRTGDYWLVPARTATGDVIWPRDAGVPRAMPAHGIDHHYAPLALVDPGTKAIVTKYQRHFEPMAKV